MVAIKINLKNIVAPSTCAAIVGFIIGVVSPIRKLIIDDDAPLRVIYTSAALVGEGAIPTITLIIGGNLLSGFRGAGMKKRVVVGVVVVRYIFLPLIGITVVKVAHHFGFIKSDP